MSTIDVELLAGGVIDEIEFVFNSKGPSRIVEIGLSMEPTSDGARVLGDYVVLYIGHWPNDEPGASPRVYVKTGDDREYDVEW